MTMLVDDSGRPIHYRDCWAPAGASLVVIADRRKDGSYAWRASATVPTDLEKSCRGFEENTVVELGDGRIAMLIRGSNEVFHDRLGCKWQAFSHDGGHTWSAAEPWRYDDGEPVRSSATGSAVFRSAGDGQLYWIGNICADGDVVRGNWPRSPLVIGRIDAGRFVLVRASLTVIDQRHGGDSAEVQMSNFRYYQDRHSGDVVLFLTRFGERSAERWKLADTYRYRITID
jgi:hypothetical protein